MWQTILLLGALWGSPALAAPPSSDDAAAIESLIRGQLDAFARGDARAAYAPVAPGLRETFTTPDRFLEMVRSGYGALIQPRSVRFEAPLELPDGTIGQLLHVVGPDGRPSTALYLIERQPDGSFRTSGCLLREGTPGPPSV